MFSIVSLVALTKSTDHPAFMSTLRGPCPPRTCRDAARAFGNDPSTGRHRALAPAKSGEIFARRGAERSETIRLPDAPSRPFLCRRDALPPLRSREHFFGLIPVHL